ncbi:MAG: hypothetical protein ACRDJF_00140 [Actinomycetota bacterium]
MSLKQEIGRPLRWIFRAGLGLLALFALIAALVFFWFLSGFLESLAWRLVVGLALSIVVGSLGVGYFRQLGNPPPPDPEPMEVHPAFRLAYLCEMCGLELAVLKVAKERAPKHCGEEMVLIRKEEP